MPLVDESRKGVLQRLEDGIRRVGDLGTVDGHFGVEFLCHSRSCNVKTCRQGHEFKTGGYMSAYVMHIHPALERGHESVDNVGRHFFFAFQRIDHGIGPADNGYFIRVMTEARP